MSRRGHASAVCHLIKSARAAGLQAASEIRAGCLLRVYAQDARSPFQGGRRRSGWRTTLGERRIFSYFCVILFLYTRRT